MVLQQFPDLRWLRRQAATNFHDRRDAQGRLHAKPGWPNVILHTAIKETERTDIKGPFSLFVNLRGHSTVRVEGRELVVKQDTCCITNQGQFYDLLVRRDDATTQTFNIHFGDSLYQDVFRVISHKESQLLDSPYANDASVSCFQARTLWQDPTIRKHIEQLVRFSASEEATNTQREEELLSACLKHLLGKELQLQHAAHDLNAIKRSTKEELRRRVYQAIDFLHDTFPLEASLDQLSLAACLSKYHLLRSFKQLTGQTPQQYQASLRLDKSLYLLQDESLSLTNIAEQVGFSELAAFSRFFRRHQRISPRQYRWEISKLG